VLSAFGPVGAVSVRWSAILLTTQSVLLNLDIWPTDCQCSSLKLMVVDGALLEYVGGWVPGLSQIKQLVCQSF
jgi:hypothetical protein